MGADPLQRPRCLVLVLGDQLDAEAAAFDGCDPARDAIWMAEVSEESTHVASSKARIALFLAAMRQFAHARRAAGWTVHYTHLDEPGNTGSLGSELRRALRTLRPGSLRMNAPGDWRVLAMLREAAGAEGLELRPCAARPAWPRTRWPRRTSSPSTITRPTRGWKAATTE